jgi:hypothetical protein
VVIYELWPALLLQYSSSDMSVISPLALSRKSLSSLPFYAALHYHRKHRDALSSPLLMLRATPVSPRRCRLPHGRTTQHHPSRSWSSPNRHRVYVPCSTRAVKMVNRKQDSSPLTFFSPSQAQHPSHISDILQPLQQRNQM